MRLAARLTFKLPGPNRVLMGRFRARPADLGSDGSVEIFLMETRGDFLGSLARFPERCIQRASMAKTTRAILTFNLASIISSGRLIFLRGFLSQMRGSA